MASSIREMVMRYKVIFLLPLAIGMALSSTAAWAFKNEPNGFRSMKWGDPISSVQDKMTQVESEGFRVMYKKNDDTLSLGEFGVSKILYIFDDARFFQVVMFSDPGQIQLVKEFFFKKFGEVKKLPIPGENFYWDGAYTRIRVNCDNPENTCAIFITSTEIEKREEASGQ